uniref:Ribosome biogenesis regulatory protein n=1 Tax=Amorphochlora amoebiformis TaxID=1561963 RepID=A0A7S0GLR6_9EUKA
MERARSNVEQLLGKIFALPTEDAPYGNGKVVTLPEPTTKLPREKPVPRPREATKWEKFAKIKGIAKRKKDKIVFDEQKQEWRRTWGYKKANDVTDSWAIPAKEGEVDGMDPWSRASKEKQERVANNRKKQINNLKAASGDRVAGTLDLASVVSASAKKGKKRKHRQRQHVDVALALSQKSTASMGKFDKLHKYEPEIKRAPKPKHDASFQKSYLTEKATTMKLLDKIVAKADPNKININKAVNIAQQEAEVRKRAKKGRAGKRLKRQE